MTDMQEPESIDKLITALRESNIPAQEQIGLLFQQALQDSREREEKAHPTATAVLNTALGDLPVGMALYHGHTGWIVGVVGMIDDDSFSGLYRGDTPARALAAYASKKG